ncbi:hypothetical protein STRPS_0966 [Streptococcus pseudoporcinus LQ 940-04]|uniref:Uncharacterized protein n=1 Tax=Streptococcus pseudoporcinus LQ 940-04 TaxID=875093 RepID=G5K7C6_9STRE|nr:hypothetical protein HMPREF9320_0079 [Streptococcus pseudoporcinus SPIN 20026]EHI64388.1 hypothetical protein STRPS_0966 [Streptococcus pseudoporcinus LQ 940-04]
MILSITFFKKFQKFFNFFEEAIFPVISIDRNTYLLLK